MSSTKTFVKLGLFTIVAVVAAVVAAFGLGVHSVSNETFRYHTYFDESVQGLEVGSQVKYRGVSVGSVSAVEIAPDRRHVDVSLAMKVREIDRLGLAAPPLKGRKLIAVPPDLRAQLGSQGITGVKFVSIDFFDPKTNPIPKLAFEPDPCTIPAAASLMKGLEDTLTKALDRLPDVLESVVASLAKIGLVLDDFQGEHIPQAAVKAITNMNGAVTDLRRLVAHVDQARIPDKTAKAIDDISVSMAKVNLVLDRVGGEKGLVDSTKVAVDRASDVGRNVAGGAAELERTLRDVGEAARAIRDLADAIDRDPDMLVKGRATPRQR